MEQKRFQGSRTFQFNGDRQAVSQYCVTLIHPFASSSAYYTHKYWVITQ